MSVTTIPVVPHEHPDGPICSTDWCGSEGPIESAIAAVVSSRRRLADRRREILDVESERRFAARRASERALEAAS